MALQAIWGGDHSGDQQHPRQSAPKKVPEAGQHGEGHEHPEHQYFAWLSQDSARLVLNDRNQVIMVQLMDADGQVVQEIAPDQLNLLGYHGVLVDLNT